MCSIIHQRELNGLKEGENGLKEGKTTIVNMCWKPELQNL
jgi:hypothetical protein